MLFRSDEASEDTICLVLLARGEIERLGEISRVFSRLCVQDMPSIQIVVEDGSGRRYSSIWRDHSRLSTVDRPPETLQFAEEEINSQSSGIGSKIDLNTGPRCGLEIPQCGDHTVWIVDELGRKRLWLPDSLRNHYYQWRGRKLLLRGYSTDTKFVSTALSTGRFVLIDFDTCGAWRDARLQSV